MNITPVEKVAFSLVAFVIGMVPVIIFFILGKKKLALLCLAADILLITFLLYMFMV